MATKKKSPAHTTEPWTVNAYRSQSTGWAMYELEGVSETDAEMVANAHLIAAAPALLERCKMSLKDAQDALSGDWKPTAEGWRSIIGDLQSVIAKAYGNS